jgi:hypothetical protein
VNRDAGSVEFAASTDTRNNRTNLYIDVPDGKGNFDGLELDGRLARSLYNLLDKHYRSL